MWQESPARVFALTPSHPLALIGEQGVLPLVPDLQRGRQSDKEVEGMASKKACLLRRASNQLRNNNCMPKLTLHLQPAASGQPMELHRQQGWLAPLRARPQGGGRGEGEPGNPLESPPLFPTLPPSWLLQRWARARVTPEGTDQVCPGEQRTHPPARPLLWADQRPWPTFPAGLRQGRRNAGGDAAP